MRIGVITRDKYLLRRIELELCDDEVFSIEGEAYAKDSSADAIIYDVDSGLPSPEGMRTLHLSRKPDIEGAYSLPLPIGKLNELVNKESDRLTFIHDDRAVLLDGKRINLTAHEYSLLSLLAEGGDEYTPRERIAERVFGKGSDSLINVYIHYLRDKLETDGRKIILASRKLGYRLDEKYIGGGKC